MSTNSVPNPGLPLLSNIITAELNLDNKSSVWNELLVLARQVRQVKACVVAQMKRCEAHISRVCSR